MKKMQLRRKPQSSGTGTPRRSPLLSRGQRLVRDKLQGKVFLIPSFITVVGIFCGFLALISAFKGNFEYATKCIALAILLDGLDGRVARGLNACSAFGREFDSLSDLVSFGVAPAALVYCWAFASTADEFGILVSFVFVVCSATRLARFNIVATDEANKFFFGLPTPGAAAAVASAVYLIPQPLVAEYAVAIITCYLLTLAALMVSTWRFMSVKHLKLAGSDRRVILLLLSLIVALTWYHSSLSIFILAHLYAFSGPLFYFLRLIAPKVWKREFKRWS